MNLTSLLILLLLSLFIFPSHPTDLTPIGCNVSGYDYRGRTEPSINILRQAQPFMANATNRATVDEHGWPTQDFTVDLQVSGTDMKGDYSISCKGKATITSLRDGKVIKQNYDPSTNTLSATLSITEENATAISLQFSNTVNGVQNISVLLPGFDQSQAAAFNPLMIEQLKTRCSLVRYLGMLPVQRDIVSTWSDRATVENSPSWTGFCCPLERNDSSVPWEIIIDMANAIGVDIWLPQQTVSDDDYYIELAKLIKKNLDPKINVFFEIGNEMFYGSVAEYRIKLEANESVRAQGDPYKLNYDNVNNENTWGSRLVAYKAAVLLPSLFEKVFSGNVGREKRIRPMFGGHSEYSPYLHQQLEFLRNAHPGSLDTLHGVHISFYFGLGDQTDNMTVNDILQKWNNTLQGLKPNLKNQPYAHATYAAWYGIPHVYGYEGGPGSFGPDAIPAKVEANLSPVMQQYVEELYDTWHSYGFGILNYFHFGADSYNSRFGQWAVQTSMHDPNVPKVKALDAIRSKPKPKMDIGMPVPLKNHSAGKYLTYHNENPYITWVVFGSEYFYPLRASKTAYFSFILHMATNNINETSCEIEVGYSYGGMKEPVYQILHVIPSNNHDQYVPQNPINISVADTLTGLRLRPIASDGCYVMKGEKKVIQYNIGWFDIVSE